MRKAYLERTGSKVLAGTQPEAQVKTWSRLSTKVHYDNIVNKIVGKGSKQIIDNCCADCSVTALGKILLTRHANSRIGVFGVSWSVGAFLMVWTRGRG